MEEIRFSRQSGLVDSSIFTTPITIVGAGGIGSFTTLALAKIGFNDILVYDGDSVEEHNLPNQFYPTKMVGKMKVDALKEMIYDFTDIAIKPIPEFFDGLDKTHLRGVVISAVDSMSARKAIFRAVQRNRACSLFVDGRMGGNQLEIYTCDLTSNKDKELYEKTLFTDEQTSDVPCTMKAVMYNVLSIASLITNQVRLVLSKKPYYRIIIKDLETMTEILPMGEMANVES